MARLNSSAIESIKMQGLFRAPLIVEGGDLAWSRYSFRGKNAANLKVLVRIERLANAPV